MPLMSTSADLRLVDRIIATIGAPPVAPTAISMSAIITGARGPVAAQPIPSRSTWKAGPKSAAVTPAAGPTGPGLSWIEKTLLERFQLFAITLPAIVINSRIQQQHRHILFGNCPYLSPGHSDDQGLVGKLLSLRNERMRPD